MSADLFADDHSTLSASAHDDADVKWTENEMLRHLWRHFVAQSWAGVPQVTVALRDLDPAWFSLTQWKERHQPDDDPEDAHTDLGGALRPRETAPEDIDRRIDLLLVRPARKDGIGDLETIAVEVKVTRADFLSDVRNPLKQAPWREATTRHAYAVPHGLVAPNEVPEGSGLLYVSVEPSGWGEVEWAVRAPYRPNHAPQMPKRVIVALMHRIGQLEAATRAWNTTPAAAGSEQEVRAALVQANKASDRLSAALHRAEEARDAWKVAYAMLAADGHPCKWCGHGAKPLNPQGGWFRKWRHIDPAHDEGCKLLEAASIDREARAAYDAADDRERERRVRQAHHRHLDRFDPVVEAEPWRAFVPRDPYGVLELTGVFPADVRPLAAQE